MKTAIAAFLILAPALLIAATAWATAQLRAILDRETRP